MLNTDALRRFSVSLLRAAGSDPGEARCVADILLWGDRVGRPGQGVWRLPVLCRRLQQGLYRSPCPLRVESLSPCLAQLHGAAGQGHVLALRAMENAVELARAQGIGAVAVRDSNYFGAGAYYVNMAAQTGMIGLALSNSFPKVKAQGGREAVLGTNPLAFACPARDGEPLILDMATSALAGSTVRRRQAAGLPVEAGPLEPLGGAKGYGLSLLVEILAGVLAGAGFSHQVHSLYADMQHSGNNGHFFLAVDIGRFMPLAEFRQRMTVLADYLAASGGADRVRYPGQARWRHLAASQTRGVSLDAETRRQLEQLSVELAVPLPKHWCLAGC